MRTEKQIAASRANGAKSRGPVTPQGKLRKPQDGLSPDLLARTILLKGENRERFDSLVQVLFTHYPPESPIEIMLLHTMAAARWRIMRLWGYETAAISHKIERHPVQPGAEVPAIHDALAFHAVGTQPLTQGRHSQLEMRLDRQFHRALACLKELRSARTLNSMDPNPAK